MRLFSSHDGRGWVLLAYDSVDDDGELLAFVLSNYVRSCIRCALRLLQEETNGGTDLYFAGYYPGLRIR